MPIQDDPPVSLDSTSPIPMLPIQPGEEEANPGVRRGSVLDDPTATCPAGVNKNAMTMNGINGKPLNEFLRDNFNIIIIILVTVIVLRGR